MSQALIKKTRIFLKKSLMLGVIVICALFTLQVQAELPVAEQLKALRQQSTDWLYGYSPTQPILLGGFNDKPGMMPERMREYFAWLSSPKEISISAKDPSLHWRRVGACCSFKTPNGPIEETGLLDIYEVTVPGERPVRLFVNHYDEGLIMAPSGLYLHLSNNWQKEWAPALAAYRKGAWQQAVDELKKLVAVQQGKGGGLAEYLLQISYHNLKDDNQADDWMVKAAELKHPEALADIAVIVVNHDPVGAENMLRSGATKGGSFASLNLAFKILQDNPDTQRWLSAVFFLYIAAEQGEAAAQLKLAQVLHDDKIRPVSERILRIHDADEIMMWLQTAKLLRPDGASQIDPFIEQFAKDFAIADLKPSEDAAKAWKASFQRPDFALGLYTDALKGDAHSAYDYAIMLSLGQVVPADETRSIAWLIASCQGGYEGAVQAFTGYIGIPCQDLSPTAVAKITSESKREKVVNGLRLLQAWVK